MEISTTTIQGKTGLEIEALIREAYESGERNFTTDLPTDIFDPSSIGSTQWDADGTPCTDWGFNVGGWDLVAARVTEAGPKVDDFFAVFKDKYFIRLYGVTEIFVVDGLLHTTSNFALPPSLHVRIAEHIRGFGIPCE